MPIVNSPTSGDLTGWDWLWAGEKMAFGEFYGPDIIARAREIIAGEEAYLDADDFLRWFVGSNGSFPFVRPCFFYGNTVLETVEFPPMLTSIGERAFGGCTALTSVEWEIVANGFYLLQSIGTMAFYGCTSLETVDIRGDVYFSSIGAHAFASCPNLTTVTIRKSLSPPTLGSGAFDTTSLQHIYVPASAVNAYKTAAGWSNYASYISAIPT